METVQHVLNLAQSHPFASFGAAVVGAAFLFWLSSSSTPSRKKAIPLVKDPKPGVVYLFQFPPAFKSRNISPFCLKLESYLRIANIPFEIVRGDHYFKSATLKLPFIQVGDQVINDSGLIISYLKKNFKNIDANLTQEQNALTLAYKRLVEEHLYFGSVYFRWLYQPSATIWLPEAFRGVPALLRGFVTRMAVKGVKRDLWGQGIARYTDEEKLVILKDDLDALSTLLGKKKNFVVDGETHELDVVVYSLLANILNVPMDTPLKSLVHTYKNLCAFADAMDKIVNAKKNE